MNFSIVSVINDFIKMYYRGVRFMLQSQAKDRRTINTTELQNRIKKILAICFGSRRRCRFLVGGEETGSMSHNSSS
jgi:hypothetical protein